MATLLSMWKNAHEHSLNRECPDSKISSNRLPLKPTEQISTPTQPKQASPLRKAATPLGKHGFPSRKQALPIAKSSNTCRSENKHQLACVDVTPQKTRGSKIVCQEGSRVSPPTVYGHGFILPWMAPGGGDEPMSVRPQLTDMGSTPPCRKRG